MTKSKKKNPKFTHEAKMIVTNEKPKKVPSAPLSPGFRYVEVEITNRMGEKTKDVVMLHEQQIKQHKK
jgi:hypothetical protein